MRKALTTLIAIAAAATAAAPASADVSNATYTYSSSGSSDGSSGIGVTCRTPNQYGVQYQYGAWGFYIDGCTARVQCPVSARWCTATTSTKIVAPMTSDKVTMNARLRDMNADGSRVYAFRDKSCAELTICSTTDTMGITHGDSVSIQCNGVRANRVGPENYAYVVCGIQLDIHQS